MNAQRPWHRRFHLLDLVALVVGYSLASLLVRAFWPAVESPGIPSFVVLTLAFLWLGLAMSGPVVLMGHRRAGRRIAESAADSPSEGEAHAGTPEPRTWAEIAWLIIGFYWITLTVLVVPVRLHNTRVLDSALLGLFPVLAALALRVFGPASLIGHAAGGQREWTHHAAVALLATWPFAWVSMILLGTTLP